MEAIQLISVAEPAKAYAQLDAYKGDALQIDANLSHMVDALKTSQTEGGMVKPYQQEVLRVLGEPELDQAALMAASIRLNEASANASLLQSAVSMAAAIPNKLLKLGGGG